MKLAHPHQRLQTGPDTRQTRFKVEGRICFEDQLGVKGRQGRAVGKINKKDILQTMYSVH